MHGAGLNRSHIPLISQPAGDGNYHPGMSVNMRYRNLDAIPFNESIKSDIELWHWVRDNN